jgi:hypothetical protein
LINEFKDTIHTDLGPPEILALARLGARIDVKNMVIRTVPSYNYTTSQGAAIQMIDTSRVRAVMADVFEPIPDGD